MDLLGVPLDGLLHPQGGVAGADGMVLVGERRPEESHDPVAHDLVYRAFVAVDGLHHALEDGVQELAGLLWVAVGEQFHRALQVGEEDRDLLALAFEGCLRGEDPLGEVFGRVGVRGGGREAARGWRGGAETSPAASAELVARLVREAAG
jgi:hypothetical protein